MIRRSEAIALLECMAQNALGAFASADGQEKESAAQHYKALDMAIAELKRAEGDPGPFVRPDNLSESEFLIVERHCVEVYSKGEYLPTPMPKDSVAIPMARDIDVEIKYKTDLERAIEYYETRGTCTRIGDIVRIALREKQERDQLVGVVMHKRQKFGEPSLALPYCGNCSKIVLDAAAPYCCWCGRKLKEVTS